MPQCALCGAEVKKLHKIRLEGSIIEVCDKCVKFGELIPEKTEYKPKVKKPKSLEVEELVPEYGNLIKKYREARGLTRENFAKVLAEKESVIRRIETNNMVPSEQLRRKIEKFFGINLLRKYEDEARTRKGKKKTALTLGDVIEVR